MTDRFHIRERDRVGRPKEAFGAHVAWHEYQVVDGRKIVARLDLREQAERWIKEQTA